DDERRETSIVPSGASSHNQKQRKRLRKADTNVLSIKFNRLLQPDDMHAGDPVYCTECGAITSHLSKIQNADGEDSKWQYATYLVSPAPVVHGSDMTGVDDSIVIFLIDTSGSMSSTTLVKGTFQLPNALQQQERAAANFDGERLVRNKRETYVTRLQGVQMAVDANLDKLVKDTPTRRAAL
ncbi:unnamed protein product, partial [Adineta steineri]